MKKLLIMTNTLYGGGAEKVLQTILRNLDYKKYDVTLFSMHREELIEESYPKNIHYKVVFDRYKGGSSVGRCIFDFFGKIKGKLFQWLPSSLFYRLIIREKYDVEIAFIEGESTKIVAGSTNRESKKIAWVHIDLLANPWTAFLYKDSDDEKKHYMRFDRICCVSESVREAFVKKYGLLNNEQT